jgi:hypothetical protein
MSVTGRYGGVLIFGEPDTTSDYLEPGTLPGPGMVGRTLRLILGLLCLHSSWQLLMALPYLSDEPFASLHNLLLKSAITFCLFNYVVNLGCFRSWGNTPRLVSVTALVALAVPAYLSDAALWSFLFGLTLSAWLAYFFMHLGLSLILAAVMATPGCEMRAIPDLLNRLRRKRSNEHACPISFLNRLDSWESHLKKGKA